MIDPELIFLLCPRAWSARSNRFDRERATVIAVPPVESQSRGHFIESE